MTPAFLALTASLIIPPGFHPAGSVVTVTGELRGGTAAVAVPAEYKNAELAVTRMGRGLFRVPVVWDKALPASVPPGATLRFTAQVPADRLLVRCVPPASCGAVVVGPLPPGRAASASLPLDWTTASISVRDSGAVETLWQSPRVADKGDLKISNVPPYHPGQLYLEFAPTTSLAAAEAAVMAEGFRVLACPVEDARPTKPGSLTMIVLAPPDMTIEAAMERLQKKKIPFVQPVFHQ